jgi:hypothetical protein
MNPSAPVTSMLLLGKLISQEIKQGGNKLTRKPT